MILGFSYVLAAGILQGLWLLPMDRVRGWRWEESWLGFSFFGMLAFNWLFTLATIPQILDIYRAAPANDLGRLLLFGLGCGVGAVLFGLGMARLGLALGYAIIMGLIASLGALVPLLLFFPQAVFSAKGALIIGGTLVVLIGILLCSRAAEIKTGPSAAARSGLVAGLVIAIAAGALSSLPNIGMTFAGGVIASAQAHGVSATLAGNAVWALFFTAEFSVNAGYCLYRMWRARGEKPAAERPLLRNLFWTALMGILWIGSFYGYGVGAARLGPLGPVVGWPLFIIISIAVGNVVGLMRGEWRGASMAARGLLAAGLAVLIAAVTLIAAGGALT
ncbi:MAG TPA: L-rhamnose/proton symporter RhaT [Rhizomicrobium sp.]|jgi:L-rhamnose-H+ transport protein|nr:L-rhamnose/proton symporter RhaT [Rhizomicrobium sp.]